MFACVCVYGVCVVWQQYLLSRSHREEVYTFEAYRVPMLVCKDSLYCGSVHIHVCVGKGNWLFCVRK